jgi:hypothetical protein
MKLGVRLSAHEQRDDNVPLSARQQMADGAYDPYLQRLFTDVIHPPETISIVTSVPSQNPSNPPPAPDSTSPEATDARRPDTRVAAARPDTGFAAEKTSHHLNNGLANPTPATVTTASVPHRALEADLRTNKITADGQASIHGIVRDAKGEPIKGAGIRIESRDGKQVFSTLKTDPKGRYNSQGLQPGVYRVTLLVDGAIRASIMNTESKANEPTQLNFDLKQTSQVSNVAKGGKHMIWVPNRTGSHIGGNWVEIDDEGNAHFDSNIQTYSVRH